MFTDLSYTLTHWLSIFLLLVVFSSYSSPPRRAEIIFGAQILIDQFRLFSAVMRTIFILLVSIVITTANIEVKTPEESHTHPNKVRCGAPLMGYRTRPCHNNDTDCGTWADHFWHPHHCNFRDISSEDARKCLGSRTLAFIGDSMIRDIGFGVYSLLSGNDSIKDAPTHKYDKGDRHPAIPALAGGIALKHGSRIPNFPQWKSNVPGPNYNGFVYPKQPNDSPWQIQIWNLFRNEFQHHGQIEDVVGNRLVREKGQRYVVLDANGKRMEVNEAQIQESERHKSGLHPMEYGNIADEIRPIDFAFLQHALHDAGYWWDQPFGERLYNTVIRKWRMELYPMGNTPGGYETTPIIEEDASSSKSANERHHYSAAQSTWVSMNPNVGEWVSAFLTRDSGLYQERMVEEASAYLNRRFLHEQLPYWDAGAPLRSHQRKSLSADGVHVKMLVDIMRAKMLFNHLCDDDMNWRGSPEVFM